MVINIPHMGDIRAKILNHLPNFASCLRGINRMRRQPSLVQQSGHRLEIDVRYEMAVVIGWLATIVCHGK